MDNFMGCRRITSGACPTQTSGWVPAWSPCWAMIRAGAVLIPSNLRLSSWRRHHGASRFPWCVQPWLPGGFHTSFGFAVYEERQRTHPISFFGRTPRNAWDRTLELSPGENLLSFHQAYNIVDCIHTDYNTSTITTTWMHIIHPKRKKCGM